MISITPNLRNVKPTSKYMEKRIRMLGRSRLANEYTKTGNNQKVVTLPWYPSSKELLEIYLDSVRVLDGYTLAGSVITFTKPVNGTLTVLDDTQLIDTDAKWLKITVPNLLHSDDFDNTGYGTDRRAGPQVAVHARPVAITQPGMGFVRPSPNNEELWYSPFYGLYGRDSVTYAIQADNGQLSDFRCIDIRVRDPNYIPVVRVCAASPVSQPLKVGDAVVDIVPDGNYQFYAEILDGGSITLPNKAKQTDQKEYHFIIQGLDENQEWFELTEYFDADEYKLTISESDDYVVTYVGTPELFGIENAVRISIMCKQNNPAPCRITLEAFKRTIFTGYIDGVGIKTDTKTIRDTDTIATVTVTKDHDYDGDPATLFSDFRADGTNCNTTVIWQNSIAETRTLTQEFNELLHMENAYWNPDTKAYIEKDYAIKRITVGTLTTSPTPEENIVNVLLDDVYTYLEPVFVWGSEDPFSGMFIAGPLTYTFQNNWSINTKFDDVT